MKVKVYDINGTTTEEITLNFDKLLDKVNFESIKQYVRVYLSNQRQGTHKVKTKSEVRGGGRKPWRQKGTGRARSGSIRSPLWVGGGITHGPVPQDWALTLGKAQALNAFKSAIMLLAEKGSIIAINVASDFEKKSSTKKASELLTKAGVADKKVLVVNSNKSGIFKSFRNIKNAEVKDFKALNTFDIVNSDYIVLEKSAIEGLNSRLSQK